MSTCILAAVAVVMTFLGAAGGPVPPPTATPVDLVVSGRTSTLRSITVECVGQNVPETYSGDQVKNAKGFEWYVSRHYALQTDYDASRARQLLTLLELAYPHYVELFGREIPGIEHTRMAVIYGASTDSLRAALEADGIAWDFGGGGVAFERINAAFNYPSGTLQYHQRYIMLHECVHLYQLCLNGSIMNTPGWYYEGVADATAHHVWEEAAQRLTMAVIDKPTVNNWYDLGLSAYAGSPFTAGDILSGKRGGRDAGFLLVNYFSSRPDLLARWRIWRDEMFRLNKYGSYQDDSARLIEELFGAGRLDADFDRWLRGRRSSFHYVDWGWEQDADAMMSYGWPQTGAYSQTDLNFIPSAVPAYDPLVMDYPLQPRSTLVDAVRRGVDEPTVGCLVGFAANPDSGVAGMALGVEGRSFAKVLVEQRKRLVIDATEVGGTRRELEFTDAFRGGTAKTFEIGLTIRIGRDALEVTARGGDGGPEETATLSLPLEESVRTRLVSRPMAVLSRDGRHWVTPYVDDARQGEPDLSVAAPPNRWRFGLGDELSMMERAAWRLGDAAPPSLLALRDRLLAAGGGDAAVEAGVRADFVEELGVVMADVENSGAPEGSVAAALGELRRK